MLKPKLRIEVLIHVHKYFCNSYWNMFLDRPSKQTQDQEEKFHSLPSDHQHAILTNKLKYFQNVLSPGEYIRFLQDFKASFR